MNSVQLNISTYNSLRDMNQAALKFLKLSTFPDSSGMGAGAAATAAVDTSNSLSRDSSVFGSRPMVTDKLVPELNTPKQGIIENFDQIRSSREMNDKGPVSPMNIKPINDKPISEDTFQRQLNEMANERLRLPPPPPSSTVSVSPAPANIVDLVETRQVNEQQSLIPPMPTAIDVLNTATATAKRDAYSSQQSVLPLETPLRMPTELLLKTPQTSIQEKYLLVNSFDREWTVQKERYRYKVKFVQSTKEIRRLPYYENNPVVPFTATATTSGLPNTSGWFDTKTNIAYPPYDSAVGKGDIIGYEEIQYAADADANVQSRFKNVTSISVSNVIVPMDIATMNNSSSSLAGTSTAIPFFNNNYNFNYPYVLLQIDEFNDIYDGTDDTIRRAFCQLVIDTTYFSNNGRGYIVLRPAQGEKKVFQPTALATLPTLSLSLLKPNGDLMNSSQDGFTLLKLEHEGYNRAYIKVVTNTYFDRNEFYRGDNVVIRHFTLFKITNAQDSAQISRFNQFINQPTGHEILEIGDANDNGYYRTFYIQAPGSFDSLIGQFVIDEATISQLDLFNQSVDFTVNSANGYILNVSLQNSVSFRIEQKVYESTTMSVNV